MARNLSRIMSENRWAAYERWAKNAIVESLVLHTRILSDILLGKKTQPDDITVTDLIPGFSSTHTASLAAAYGDSKTVGSPCWQFNKLLAHATSHRSDSHEYLPALKALSPHIVRM